MLSATKHSLISPQEMASPPAKAPWHTFDITRFAAYPLLAILALCVLAAVSYYPASLAQFVWDDYAFTTALPVQNLSGIWQIWFQPTTLVHEGHYWPIVYTTFWLQHKLWGYSTVAYHVANIVFHIFTSLLLWRLMWRLEISGAWLIAAIFAIHPVHVEPVAWVIGRKDVLAGLFTIACLLTYLRFGQSRRLAHYLFALCLYVLSMFCKTTVVTLPVVILIMLWWKNSNLTRHDIFRITPFLLVGGVVTIANWLSYSSREVLNFSYTLIEISLFAAQSLWFYATKVLWPTNLAIVYQHWEVGTGNLVAWACLISSITMAVALWTYRNRIGRGPFALLAFFVVTLSPTLGFIDYGYMQFSFVADRYQYIASAGVIIAAVGIAVHIGAKLPGILRTVATWVLPTIILSIFASLTWAQSSVYENRRSFFEYIVAHNPTARNAQYNLGNAYYSFQQNDKALEAYLLAIEQRPSYQPAHIGAGFINLEQGDLKEAEKYYGNALRLDPKNVEALEHFGQLELIKGSPLEAMKYFRHILRVNPSFAKAYYGIGVALTHLNRYQEALQYIDQALALNPNLEDVQAARLNLLALIKKANADAVKQ